MFVYLYLDKYACMYSAANVKAGKNCKIETILIWSPRQNVVNNVEIIHWHPRIKQEKHGS